VRRESGLSVRALADAAGVAASTVHRIERVTMSPTMDMLERLASAGGMEVHVRPQVDHRAGLVGLALAIRGDLGMGDDVPSRPIRRTAELVHRFGRAADEQQRRMLGARPPSTGDPRWDAFIGGLAEWLAVRAQIDTPAWARDGDRYLDAGWWVTDLPSLRAWEYAGSPLSLKLRGVYLHRDSLVNV
jgi:transcriptional regulator with XRE-family HTH domain